MKVDQYYQQKKDSPSVDFSDVQVVHKFAWWMICKPDFKCTPFIRRWISQKQYKIDTWLLQTTNRMWCIVYWNVPSPVTLIDLQCHLSYRLFENKCSLLFRSLIESPFSLIKDDIAWRLKAILGTVNSFSVCISKIYQVAHITYKVYYRGQISCASNYFYCRIRPEGLLCDAECDQPVSHSWVSC